jgi:hypothetical protein
MPNNELTPVFNIRGANDISEFGARTGLTHSGKYNDG